MRTQKSLPRLAAGAAARSALSALSAAGIRFSRTFEGTRLRYDPSTDIGRKLLLRRPHEETELSLCRQLLRDESVVIDVGANIGLHTVVCARAAAGGIVIAIEAAPRTYVELLHNVSNLANVVPMNIALSSECGVAEFYLASDDAYSGLKDTQRFPIRRRVRVPCYTGDAALVPLLAHGPDFIKIDVEGLEREVIEGMSQMIQVGRPIILCEICANPEQIISGLVRQGYEAFVIKDEKCLPLDLHHDAYANYLFVPHERAAQVRGLI